MKIYKIECIAHDKVWESKWSTTHCAVIVARDEGDARAQFLQDMVGDLKKDEDIFDPKKFTCEVVVAKERGIICMDDFCI